MGRLTDYLPAGARGLAEAVDRAALPEETRADCSRCPMVADPELPWAFDPEMRCCSFHPSLANFLAGRALARGGESADRIRERMRDPNGVTAWGIRTPPDRLERYLATADQGFGRDRDHRCPFWVPGELSCGIWHDRSATCRTWFCRFDGGERGAKRWAAVDEILVRIERRIGERLVELGDPPQDHEGLEAWYLACAERAEAIAPDEIGPMDGDLGPAERELARQLGLPERPAGDRLVPAITEVVRLGDRVALFGYSPYDPVVAPGEVFDLLSRLDGTTSLSSARDKSIDPGGDVVEELVRIGALEEPPNADS